MTLNYCASRPDPIPTMITWLDQHVGPLFGIEQTFREAHDAGLISDQDIITCWLASQAADREETTS